MGAFTKSKTTIELLDILSRTLAAQPSPTAHTASPASHGQFAMDRQVEFEKFKAKCAEEGFLAEKTNEAGDDLTTGINDDGALWHVALSLMTAIS